jgi:hypothetical protein
MEDDADKGPASSMYVFIMERISPDIGKKALYG